MTFWSLVLSLSLISSHVLALENEPRKGIHLPLVRREVRREGLHKRAGNASIGIGDFVDVTYNVLVQVGEVETPLVLDTGSADLWVISDTCIGNCSSSVPLYPQTTFSPSGLTVQLLYGDSRTGTHATGPIGKDAAGIAGLSLQDQYLAAIVDTNTTVLETGSAGILGLGFPAISVVWRQLIQAQLSGVPTKKGKRVHMDLDYHRPAFPSFDFMFSSVPPQAHAKRQNATALSTPEFIDSFATLGPLFSRMISQHELAQPMFATTLQRDSIDIGGNVGQLSIGELPSGIASESLTWVPLRAYSVAEHGLPPPTDAPNEVYPLVWEIAIDDVYFDGAKLARSALSAPTITLSALVDTGNSLIRGPQDVIASIMDSLGGETFDCSVPHNLTFLIGGKSFPIDPRDFIHQTTSESNEPACSANLAVTDPPSADGFLYSWSLGDPFLKSVLAAFYYGNLTRPSQDPPRIGLMSTVPSDGGERLKQAISAAEAVNAPLAATSHAAPSGTYAASATGVGGVPQATSVSNTNTDASANAARGTHGIVSASLSLALCGLVTALALL
ncbi:acid protease [Phanerochaete sordida]|uniref:Acid protease n=1 Tax=Phanerochaete sordida TaxID=48140 RepID=A0A9P3LN91_9APHY|nr:acid protease [Phanerochaete sordida]